MLENILKFFEFQFVIFFVSNLQIKEVKSFKVQLGGFLGAFQIIRRFYLVRI